MSTLILFVLLLAQLSACESNIPARTLISKATGNEIVCEVVQAIKESEIFPNYDTFLRRLAWVESKFGTDQDTFANDYYGGIWQINAGHHGAFTEIIEQAQNNGKLHIVSLAVKGYYGIDISKVEYHNLVKPFYSGLFATLRLFMIGGNVPDDIDEQAKFYEHEYLDIQHNFQEKFKDEMTTMEKNFGKNCTINNCHGDHIWPNNMMKTTLSFTWFTSKSEQLDNLADIELIEQGPYVYDVNRKKVDLFDNSTFISYRNNDFYSSISNYILDETENISHLSQLSRSESDLITFLNYPTLGVIDNLIVDELFPGQQMGKKIFETNRDSYPKNQTTLFITRSVVDLLFDGIQFDIFKNPLVNMFTHISKFAIFDQGKNATEEEWVVDTGIEHPDDKGQLIEFDNKPLLTNSKGDLIWKNDSQLCNELKGTDGTVFKPNVQKTDTLYVFEPQLCRTVFYYFWKESKVQNITTYRFVVPQEYYDSPKVTRANDCYYGRNEYDGILDISLCDRRSLGGRLMMSAPFFNHADSKLRKQFKGEIKPDMELNDDNYGTYLDVEPITGTVINSVKRYQLNVNVPGDTPLIERETNNTTNYIVPVFWMEEKSEATKDVIKEVISCLSNKG